MIRTEDFYQQNAQEYFDSTVNVDVKKIHARFLPHVTMGGSILDAGCGSGRDSKVFMQAGYDVKAIDAAPALAELATQYLNQKVDVLYFHDINFQHAFDGIWACASLLHVPENKLPEIFLKLHHALKSNGVLYASFKYGSRESVSDDGRRFTNMNEINFHRLMRDLAIYNMVEAWTSKDCSPGRESQSWFNVLLKAREDG